MQRFKKKKNQKNKSVKPQKMFTEEEMVYYIELTNYLNGVAFGRYFHDVKGYGEKRLKDMYEGAMAILDEVGDGRRTIFGEYADFKEITGIDIKQIYDKAYGSYNRVKRMMNMKE